MRASKRNSGTSGQLYQGPITEGLAFQWGDLGRCTILAPPSDSSVVRFVSPVTLRRYQVSESYWRRMADVEQRNEGRD